MRCNFWNSGEKEVYLENGKQKAVHFLCFVLPSHLEGNGWMVKAILAKLFYAAQELKIAIHYDRKL